MALNRSNFFTAVRTTLFAGKLNQQQVNGMTVILDEWEKRALVDLRKLGALLGNTKRETDSTMWPIEEYGHGAGQPYGEPGSNGKVFFGRGFVQLTWERNYKLMTHLLNVDIWNDPDKALVPEIAVQILFEGCLNATSGVGDFTGKSFDDYFTGTLTDFVNARRVINGTDHAAEIAVLSEQFFYAAYGASQ